MPSTYPSRKMGGNYKIPWNGFNLPPDVAHNTWYSPQGKEEDEHEEEEMGWQIIVTVESGVCLHDLNESGKYSDDEYCYKQDNY